MVLCRANLNIVMIEFKNLFRINNLLSYLIQVFLRVSLELVILQETDNLKIYGQVLISYTAKQELQLGYSIKKTQPVKMTCVR